MVVASSVTWHSGQIGHIGQALKRFQPIKNTHIFCYLIFGENITIVSFQPKMANLVLHNTVQYMYCIVQFKYWDIKILIGDMPPPFLEGLTCS